MKEAQFPDWGSPIGEMMYEALRYYSGKKAATTAYAGSTTKDAEVGLSSATWDDPYDTVNSAAKSRWCSKPNILTLSDTNVSFDSDQLPGVYSGFGSFSGDIAGLNVSTEANTISANEPDVAGKHFIGQSGSTSDNVPTAKTVASLSSIRGLAPEEPTKQGSYYSAAVAYFGKHRSAHVAHGHAIHQHLRAGAGLAAAAHRGQAAQRQRDHAGALRQVGGWFQHPTQGQLPADQPDRRLLRRADCQLGAADANSSVNGGATPRSSTSTSKTRSRAPTMTWTSSSSIWWRPRPTTR
jgi:hypothetical protein